MGSQESEGRLLGADWTAALPFLPAWTGTCIRRLLPTILEQPGDLKNGFACSLRRSTAKTRPDGTGVICETWAGQAAVIPAKAGIHLANLRKRAVDGLDSRFRGNDRRFERDPTPNDTATDGRQLRWVAVRSMLSVGVKWTMEIPVE